MHSLAECMNHLFLLSFYVLDIKFILTEEFQPSTLPSIQGRLIKQILHTIMVCTKLKPISHEVVLPLPQSMYYGYQLQIMSGIVPFTLFQFFGLETYQKSVLTKDSSNSFFARIGANQKIFIRIYNLQNWSTG
jgi:hypothetical protein